MTGTRISKGTHVISFIIFSVAPFPPSVHAEQGNGPNTQYMARLSAENETWAHPLQLVGACRIKVVSASDVLAYVTLTPHSTALALMSLVLQVRVYPALRLNLRDVVR